MCGGICIGFLHMLVLRKAIEQNGAQNAPCFCAERKNFRRTQNGAEREAPAKVERGDRLMPVSDMTQSGF